MPPLIGPQTAPRRRRRAVSTGQASTAPASFALGRADRNLSPSTPGPGSRRAVERAQTRLPQRQTPAIPDLPGRPTRAQAETIRRLSQRSLQRQVPYEWEPRPGSRARRARQLEAVRREMQEDPRTRRRLAPVREAARTPMRNARVRTGMDALRANPEAFGATPQIVRGLHRLATRNALPEALRSTLAAIGRGVETSLPVAAKAGRPHSKVKAAGVSVDLTQIGKTAGNALAAATSLDTGDLGPKRAVNKILTDLGIIGTFPVTGGYQIGRALWEAKVLPTPLAPLQIATGLTPGGDPTRARELAKGVAEQLAWEATHPVEAFKEHPVLTGLDFAGAASIAGRVAGAGVRGATGGRRGSIERSPLAMVDDAGTRLMQERRFSKDLIRREIQKWHDATFREPLRSPSGDVVHEAMPSGRSKPVLLAREGMERDRLLRRRANFDAGQQDSVNRLVREIEHKEGRIVTSRRKSGIKGREARDVVAMVAEGTILTAERLQRDLRSHARRLENEVATRDRLTQSGEAGGWSSRAHRQAALERLERVERIAEDPKVLGQAQKIAQAGIDAASRLRARDPELHRVGVASREAVERAPLLATAIEHLGGRHFSVEEHARLEGRAKGREQAAQRAVDDLKRTGAPAADVARAEALTKRLRQERIAISGRHPDLVRAHEAAREQVDTAKARVGKARKLEQKAERARTRLVGAQQSRRGRRQADARGGALKSQTGARPEGHATKAEQAKLAKADAALAQARQTRRAAEKQHRKAQTRLAQSPMPDINAGVRHADGRFMSNAEIENFLRREGRDPQTVAKLPHVLPDEAGAYSARAHYQQNRVDQRPLEGVHSTTGELYRSGASAATAELLRDAGVRQATVLARAAQMDRAIGEVGLRHPAWAKAQRGERLTKHEQKVVAAGGYWTGPEAAKVIRKLELDGGQPLVALRGHAGSLPESVRAVIRGDLQGPAGMETLPQQLLNGRMLRVDELGGNSARNVVLAPAEWFDQMNAHLASAGPMERFFQMLNRPFRMAVLPQPRWLTGNFVEPYLVRLPTVGSGVVNVPGLLRDIRITNRALRMLRERQANTALSAAERAGAKRLADEIEGHHLGGLFIGRRGASNRRTRDDFKTWGHIVRRMPVMDDVANAMAAAYRFVTWPLEQFFKVNRIWIESPAQKAGFGKKLREEMQGLRGSWAEAMRAADGALEDALKGLVNTPRQERFMRYQHELLGKYEGFGPVTRRLTQSIAPFLPWALAAARFVYWTMPVHRTAQTALLIKTQQVVQQAWDAEHADVPPGSLKLDPRNSRGGLVPIARYTPYGLTGSIVEGDPQGITDQFFPQLSGLAAALGGIDPFNQPLRGEPSEGNPEGRVQGFLPKLGVGAYGLAEGLVPYLSTARRLREGGRTGYAGSTVWNTKTKPGTETGMEGHRVAGVEIPASVYRTLYPFRATYLRSPAAQGGPIPKQARSYWEQAVDETGATSADALPDEDYWRALAAGAP